MSITSKPLSFRTVLAILGFISLHGCTTIGHNDSAALKQTDFGPQETVNVCLYVDEGISEQEGRSLVEKSWVEGPTTVGININIVEVHQWKRPAFMMQGIMDSMLQTMPLEAPCDRILALVNRHFGDFMFGFVGMEILGAVNDDTLTHGYVVAHSATLAQLFMPPLEVTEHEIYHFLGCGHYSMSACYKQIAYMKQWKQENGGDFFPAWDLVNKRLFPTRAAVNAHLATIDWNNKK